MICRHNLRRSAEGGIGRVYLVYTDWKKPPLRIFTARACWVPPLKFGTSAAFRFTAWLRGIGGIVALLLPSELLSGAIRS